MAHHFENSDFHPTMKILNRSDILLSQEGKELHSYGLNPKVQN